MPEVIDVVLAATFVVGEGIEGRVEVVEHGDALEVRGLICPNVEHLGDAGDDFLPVCVCDALVEEAEDGERIDVLQLICLKLRGDSSRSIHRQLLACLSDRRACLDRSAACQITLYKS